MKLNLGSGNKRFPGYINIDSHAGSNPDHVLDLERDPLPFPDNSVDHVLAHHILEHLGNGFFHLVKELYRVCKHGTVIDVRVPHPRHDNFLIDPTHRRPIYPHSLDMFSRKRNDNDAANNGCETPLAYITGVDIRVETYQFDLDPYWLPKFQSYTEEECEHAARSFNNVIQEIHIIWQVYKHE